MLVLVTLLTTTLAAIPATSAFAHQQGIPNQVLQIRGLYHHFQNDVSLLVARQNAVTASPTTTSSSLANVIGSITTACESTCSVFLQDLQGCAAGTSQAAIATCACSSVVLGDIRTCAACIASDPTTIPANATAVVTNYNAFVDLCTQDGLASVVGTVAVGDSTTAVPRPSTTTTTSATPQSFSATTTQRSTATVPVLATPSGSVNPSNAGVGATSTSSTSTSAASSSTTTAAKSSAGTKFIVNGSYSSLLALGLMTIWLVL